MESRIQDAIEEIESLDPCETFSYRKIAAKHNADRTTLSRRHQGLQASRTAKELTQSKLHPQQEQELVDYIKLLTARRLPPTRMMIRNFASTMAKSRVSDSWVTRFLNNNADQLTSRWNNAMDRDRHRADSKTKYTAFFKELYEEMDRHEIEPRHSYNMDEKGFLLGRIGRSKRVFSRALWESGGVKNAMQDGSREWVTSLACICGDGSAIPPLLLFASKNSTLQSTWAQDIKEGTHSVHITSTPSGWSNDDVGLAWLKDVFDRYTKGKARNSWRMLILDGHGSHISAAFITYCWENKILLIIYPPHATHNLQPLDVVVFRSLSHNYSMALTNHLQDALGRLPVKKMDFFSLFWTAWTASFTQEHIIKAFEACGVWPKDPEPVLKKFHQTTPEPLNDPEFDQIQKVTEWRELRKLYNEAVPDKSTKAAKSLSASLHHLSAQYELTKLENNHLQSSLEIKKKHKKKGQVLPQLARNSGALTMSPATVKEALGILDRKKEEEAAKITRIAHSKAVRQANKTYKEQQAIAAREKRQAESERKKKEKAERGERLAQESQKKADAKASQKAQNLKRKASKSLPNGLQKKQAVGQLGCSASGVGGSEVGREPGPAPTPTITKRGRNINLPQKFR